MLNTFEIALPIQGKYGTMKFPSHKVSYMNAQIVKKYKGLIFIPDSINTYLYHYLNGEWIVHV